MKATSGKPTTKLREALLTREADLRRFVDDQLAHSDRETYDEILGRVRDPGDDSVADLIADLNIQALSRELTELGEIRATLARMQDGRFGVCVDCGGSIDAARLDANPTAQRCLPCQSRHEATFRGSEHSSL